MSFGTGQSKSNQQGLAAQQSATGANLQTLANQNFAAGSANINTDASFLQSIVSAGKSGNYNSLLTAAGPTISNITGQTQQAQESIYNTMPAGAGRDFALAQGKQGESSQIASTLNNLYTSAFPQLAQIGGVQSQIGSSQQGQSMQSTQNAFGSTTQIYQEQAAQKAAVMKSIGTIAGAAFGGPIGASLGSALGGAFGGGGQVADPVTPSVLNQQANSIPTDAWQFPDLGSVGAV